MLSAKFQTIVDDVFAKAIEIRNRSIDSYVEAETFYLTEIGMINWNPTEEASFIKNFSCLTESKRFDAEYYQPKYDQIVTSIKKYGSYNALGNLVSVNDTNFIPNETIKYRYIELSNINEANGEITGYTEEFGIDLPTRARRRVNTGDVIVSSIEGSLSTSCFKSELYVLVK